MTIDDRHMMLLADCMTYKARCCCACCACCCTLCAPRSLRWGMLARARLRVMAAMLWERLAACNWLLSYGSMARLLRALPTSCMHP